MLEPVDGLEPSPACECAKFDSELQVNAACLRTSTEPLKSVAKGGDMPSV
jgi:hypothetical protein